MAVRSIRDIRPVPKTDEDRAFDRGVEDERKDRPCLFRRIRGSFEANSDDPQADNWTQEMRAAYMRGRGY